MLLPVLETQRLIIRPFRMDDLDDIHRILDVELAEASWGSRDETQTMDERRQWLQWTVMGYEQLAKLYQPPHGDRVIALRLSGHLIGAIGYVPCLAPFEQLPSLRSPHMSDGLRPHTTEFGLYYAVSPTFQYQGYATEAARAMVDYAFNTLKPKRIVATTTYDNAASMGVMRKLGMRVEQNPLPEPPWFQVVGILENMVDSSQYL
jgi:RimJ/RimL family protein N-acetyltransferase